MNPQQPKTLTRQIPQNQSSLTRKTLQMASPNSIKNKPSPQHNRHISHSNINENLIICSKQNQCQLQYRPKEIHSKDETDFSIDSELLKDQPPVAIDIQPQIQLQVRPQIDQLIATNIRMNRYKEAYKKIQKEEEERLKSQRLKKLNQSAKQALNGAKRLKDQNKNKWGHSIYGESNQKPLNQTQKPQKDQNPRKQSSQSPNTKKGNLQNAAQLAQKRIEEYKEKEFQKDKQLQKKQEIYEKQKKLDPKKLEQVNAKIAHNAAEILKQKQQEMEQMKKRKQQIKNKIQQLSKQSLNNCKKSKKNHVKIQSGKEEDMKMGDSQYSTFEARKEGRKMAKKGKKQKNQQSQNDSKVVAQTSSRRYLKERMSKTTANFKKNKKGPATDKQNAGSIKNQEQATNKEFNKFYVWNVPIKQEDFSLVALSKKLEQEKAQNQLKKQQLSFKEQAEEFLRQKQMRKFEEERQKTRQQFLQQRVLEKKNHIMREFEELYVNH